MENLCALNNIIDKNFLYLAYNAVFPLTENSSLPFYSFELHLLGGVILVFWELCDESTLSNFKKWNSAVFGDKVWTWRLTRANNFGQ